MRVEVPARTVDEARWLVIGKIDDKHWSAVLTEEFDESFDRGEDVTAMLDLSQARRPGHEQRRVNVIAKTVGVSRATLHRHLAEDQPADVP